MNTEPANGTIVAWFDADDFPVMVYARDDSAADAAGETDDRRWYPADTSNEGGLSWEELNTSATGWKGPVRLVPLTEQPGTADDDAEGARLLASHAAFLDATRTPLPRRGHDPGE